jgi:hypothetical protein
MIYTHTLCHTLTRARDSVNNHVTQIHSRKQCKSGKYAGWQDRQLVAVDIKDSAERREETVSHTSVAKCLLKYWFAYCISTDVRMIYTHSFTRARDSVNVNSQVTHTLTEAIQARKISRVAAP